MDPALRELIAAGDPGDEVAIIVRLADPRLPPPPGLRLVAVFGEIATARALRGAIERLHGDPLVASLKAPRVYAGEWIAGPPHVSGDQPGWTEADPDFQESDRRRPENLPETGRGCVVAVIDWGLDFAHPDFRNPDGTTRLLALWDQRGADKPPPYGYGQVHEPARIDAALSSPDPFASLGYLPAPNDSPAHGTHVMGIAAGNGTAGGPEGVAPEASLLFVHLGPGVGDLGNSIDLLEALDFVVRRAGNLPLAVNMSIGRHCGPHDGTLLIERAIDWLVTSRPGTVIVQSTGNYFSRRIHMEGRLAETRRAELPFRLPRTDSFAPTVEIWYRGSDRFLAEVTAPDGSTARAQRGENAVLTGQNGHELGKLYHRAFDPNNGDHLVHLVLRPQAPVGEWGVALTGIDVVDGRWHAWIERNAACPPCQAQFASKRASGGTTTGSICNALRTLAVGAYDAHGTEPVLPPFSSAGPTRDGRPKPLLTAPGMRVLSVRSRRDPRQAPGYVRMNGTSMAAPHVTGTAALMLQAAGRQPISAIRQALFTTLAAAPDDTIRWGYGLLDTAAAVAAARRLRGAWIPAPVPRGGGAPIPLPPTPSPRWRSTMSEEYDESFDEAAPPKLRPSTQDRVIAGMSDERLRAAVTAIRKLSPAAPSSPLLVAMREAAEWGDPHVALSRAVDPGDPGTSVVVWPGQRLTQPLLPGDLLVTDVRSSRPRSVLISDPALLDRAAARQIGPGATLPGRYVSVISDRRVERLLGPDGLVPTETMVLRALPLGEAVASTPPPTIRQGSRGPAVSQAQNLLNAVHMQRTSQGESGLDACPLTVDGVFGQASARAVRAFQRIAFPDTSKDWDGLLGPRSWAALLAGGGGEDEGLPTRCPGLPKSQAIDHFEFGDHKVLPRHQPQIVGIARCVIESQKTATPIRKLRAIGHTDPVGSDTDNVTLGQRRAEAVRDEILAAIKRMTGKAASLTIEVSSRGEQDRVGDPGADRRVVIESDFAFDPKQKPPPPPPAAAATIEFVLDDDDNKVVDAKSPAATALMFGLWNDAYSGGNIRNGAAANESFVDRDQRRFYLRVSDAAAKGATVNARWHTVSGSGGAFDKPSNSEITLTRVAPGVFVSRALMLITNDDDQKLEVHSGLTSGPSAGQRKRGQSDFRLRKATLESSVVAEYAPAGGTATTVTLPVFQRKPDLRRRLSVRIVHYGVTPTDDLQKYINAQFDRAASRWMQTGLLIEKGPAIDRPIIASARDAKGNYRGTRQSQAEADACNDLMKVIPNKTVTVCFTPLPNPRTDGEPGFNAYATRGFSPLMDLEERYFIFIGLDLKINDDTLAHELHHVLHNRGDAPSADQFFTFNTTPPNGIPRVISKAITLPDSRIYHRVQMEHGNPDNDPKVECTTNWMRRQRTKRFNQPGNTHPSGFSAPDSTTGNILTKPF